VNDDHDADMCSSELAPKLTERAAACLEADKPSIFAYTVPLKLKPYIGEKFRLVAYRQRV
jgi:hypothetical protein